MPFTSQRAQSRTSRFSLWLITLLAASCSDATTVARAPVRLHDANVVALAASAAWNYYAADVTIRISGGGPQALPAFPVRQVKYRTERQLGEDGWTTTMTYESARIPTDQRLTRIAKMVVRPSGEHEFYDVDGQQLTFPEQDRFPAEFRGRIAAPPARTSVSSIDHDPREWIENILLTPAARAKARVRTENVYGVSATADASTLRYRRNDGDVAREVIWDLRRALVLEERVLKGSAVVARTTFTYSLAEPDTYIRTGIRTEAVGLNEHLRPRVVEQTLENVTVERRGGA